MTTSSGSNIKQDTSQNLVLSFKREDVSQPLVVKKRVKALKKLLVSQNVVDIKFYTELHVLECKYHKEYLQYYTKRNDIVQGNYEPTEEECDYPSDVEDVSTDEEEKIELEKLKVNDGAVDSANDGFKGIPDFWLTILKRARLTSDIIQLYDEPILRHLTDVKLSLFEEPMCFTLEFHFSPNKWFTNTVLTKEYEIQCVLDKSNPFSFEGPEIFKSKGCNIQWNKGKNVTVKEIKKKKKVKGAMRIVKKNVKIESFFHFFSTTVLDNLETNVNEDIDIENTLAVDFEIGHYFRERLIPRAVLYYTGEALLEENESDEDDTEEEFENDEDMDDDDDDDNDDEETVNDPCQDKLLNKQVNPAECKHQ